MSRRVIVKFKIIYILTSWYSKTIIAMIASTAIAVVIVKAEFFLSFFLSQTVAHNMHTT